MPYRVSCQFQLGSVGHLSALRSTFWACVVKTATVQHSLPLMRSAAPIPILSRGVFDAEVLSHPISEFSANICARRITPSNPCSSTVVLTDPISGPLRPPRDSDSVSPLPGRAAEPLARFVDNPCSRDHSLFVRTASGLPDMLTPMLPCGNTPPSSNRLATNDCALGQLNPLLSRP